MWSSSHLVNQPARVVSKRWIILVAASIAVISLAVILTMAKGRPWSNEAVLETTAKETAKSIAPTPQQTGEPTVTLWVFQLKNGGFMPAAMTGKAGNYEFLITNVSGEREGALRLESDAGKHVETINLKRGPSARKLIHLSPGNYILRVNKHRDWLTRITITEN